MASADDIDRIVKLYWFLQFLSTIHTQVLRQMCTPEQAFEEKSTVDMGTRTTSGF